MYIKQTNQPKSMKELMAPNFEPSEMGPGYRRGMVLKVYRAKIRQVVGSDGFAADITGRWMSKRGEADYSNPTLFIRIRPGSPWRHELHMRRLQIKKAINERLKCEFIKEVRIR